MRDEDNLETVQRAYKALAEGDSRTILSLLTDDVDWQFPENQSSTRITWCVRARGPREVEQARRMIIETCEVQVFQPYEFIAAGDNLVVLGHERMRVRATSRVVEAKWAQIFVLRDG